MHKEILHNKQTELLPYLKIFRKTFYLVGGTAIALHIGHRRSLDFDLFTPKPFSKVRIHNSLKKFPFQSKTIFEDSDQLHLIVNDVKLTFFYYPYIIDHKINFDAYISMPDLLTLASMKAFALGRRAKWKDYVDLFFLLKHHFSIEEICRKSNTLFGNQFSDKLFREQLSFHKDIDFSEAVEYMGKDIPEKVIMEFLVDRAVEVG